MKRIKSIKLRITLWYSALMFVLISVVLVLVGALSYRLSIDNVEKDLKAQVTQVAEKLKPRSTDDFLETIENEHDFKNVSVYKVNGMYVAGQDRYDVSGLKFLDGTVRRETVSGEDYIVFDLFKSTTLNNSRGFWIRGVESINSATLLGRTAFFVLLIIAPIIMFFTALGGYFIVKKAFHPVEEIIKTANDIYTKNDISRRIPITDDRQDELYNLSVTLNQMLDRIEYLIQKEKQFTSDVSHELRTPISVILAQSEYLFDICEDGKEKELTENIILKAKQLTKLISRLLILARIDSGRQIIKGEKIDLCELVDIAVTELQESASKKNITISTNIKYDSLIYADETLLLSALKNLISNAIKYGKQDGWVNISVSKTDDGAKIVVTDNGVGISKEHLDKIWERFYRINDVRNDEYASCGLGLSMVASIAELHGGSVSVKSEPNKGTQFTIIIKSQ